MQTQNRQKDCVHHWIIEDPNGVYSFGRCTKCNLVKRFINNWDEIVAVSNKEAGVTKVR